jgi:hypothetical protein
VIEKRHRVRTCRYTAHGTRSTGKSGTDSEKEGLTLHLAPCTVNP